MTEPDFVGKLPFCPNLAKKKTPKWTQNGPKMDPKWTFLVVFQIQLISLCCKWPMKLENDKDW